MKCSTLLVLIFLLFSIINFCYSQEFAGPYRVVVRQIDQCDDSGTHQVYATSTRISKSSRTKYLYSTNVTLEIPINDDVMVELEIAQFGNGGWRPHFMQMEFPKFCTSLNKMIPEFFKAILRALKTDCPVPPGTYELSDLDVADFKVGAIVPSFPYGKYRADFAGSNNATLIGCTRFYVDVVPAKRARPKSKPKNNS